MHKGLVIIYRLERGSKDFILSGSQFAIVPPSNSVRDD